MLIISLLGIFIPVLAQNNYINYQLSKNKDISAREIQAAEGGGEYILYLLENDLEIQKNFSLTVDKNISLDCSFDSDNLNGEEVYIFKCRNNTKNCCQLTMVINKKNLKIIDKKITRGDRNV